MKVSAEKHRRINWKFFEKKVRSRFLNISRGLFEQQNFVVHPCYLMYLRLLMHKSFK